MSLKASDVCVDSCTTDKKCAITTASLSEMNGICHDNNSNNNNNDNDISINNNNNNINIDVLEITESHRNRQCIEKKSEKKCTTHTTTQSTSCTSNEQEKINLLPPIIGYFGFMFGTVASNVFFGLIFTEKGFAPSVIGLLLSFIPFCTMTLLPVMSYIADKFHCPNLMLTVCAICSSIAIFFYCVSTNHTLVIIFFLLQAVCQTPMNPLLDRHTLMIFPPVGRAVAWSYVRAFGAYGGGVGSPVAAGLVWLCNTWGIICIQFCIGQFALLYCMWKTKPYKSGNINDNNSSCNEERASVHLRDVLLVFWENKRLPLFLFAACMMGMGYSFINNFLFIFLDSIGGPKILLGLTIVLTVSTEIPIFQYSHILFKWFTYREMISLGMVIWAFRVIIYSFLQNPWTVLIIEPLHGVTYGLLWLPSVKVVSQAFPAKLSSTATGILFTFSSGVGPIIGNLLAGVLYEKLGPRWMFRFAAFTMLGGLLLYQVTDRIFDRLGYKLTNEEEEVATETVQIENCKNVLDSASNVTKTTLMNNLNEGEESNVSQVLSANATLNRENDTTGNVHIDGNIYNNINKNNNKDDGGLTSNYTTTMREEMKREDARCDATAAANKKRISRQVTEELVER